MSQHETATYRDDIISGNIWMGMDMIKFVTMLEQVIGREQC